ncbi:hypothetical protein WK81_05775 [Burkholderia ubonensis]|uniref:DUF3443 domain-containing protein n=1 Tax=Burkholderia ubonensis TaxID=101571 RepID=UPI000752A7F3|nr:DUF3443 domain-containing protein [Burkholderia ubonensis]KVV47195.1 hypothetical protein WK81_05775 [Burkholderia ubonensis]
MRISRTFIRRLGALSLAAATAVLVAACGGGDGGGGGSPTPPAPTASNTAVITVGRGVANVINIPTVSVTVCAPGTSNCQVVDNVLVDTASYGLRLVSDAVPGVLGSLPVTTVNGAPLAECGKFVSTYTWGSVRTVDLKIGGETASALPVQILGDLGTANVPTSCTNNGTAANSASALGANGILGIGPAPLDCGATCTTSTSSLSNNYYACPNGNASCNVTLVPLAQQVANPVQRFASDNNGVIVQMPGISANGQASATGLLTFGIGTQANNALGASNVLPSTTTGDVTASFLGRTLSPAAGGGAFFDTGSNAYFFDDSQTICTRNSSFYCPSGTVNYTATLTGQNGAQATVTMPVANADTLFANSSTYAFNDIGGPFSKTPVSNPAPWLDIGLPHFYGKTIYFGMDLRGSGGAAPYVAF